MKIGKEICMKNKGFIAGILTVLMFYFLWKSNNTRTKRRLGGW